MTTQRNRTIPHATILRPAACAFALVLGMGAGSAEVLGADDEGSAPATSETAPTVDRRPLKQIYQEARLAFYGRDYTAAKAGFEAILRQRPNHELSRRYLQQIRLMEEEALRNRTLRHDAEETILPEVTVDEMNVEEAAKYLVAKSAEASGNRFKPNIVVTGLDAESRQHTVSFDLRKVPLSFALRMLGETSGFAVHYDKHAIRLAPKTAEELAADAGSTAAGKADATVPAAR